MSRVVDSYKYLSPATRTVVKAWIAREPRVEIPWTPLKKPLSESTVALVSSAGLARIGDRPFDTEREHRDPWWGDPSFRMIPRGTTEREVRSHHLHIERKFLEADLDVVLPLRRLEELARVSVIGGVAQEHYSFMGYLLDGTELVRTTAVEIAERLRAERVDAVLLVPA